MGVCTCAYVCVFVGVPVCVCVCLRACVHVFVYPVGSAARALLPQVTQPGLWNHSAPRAAALPRLPGRAVLIFLLSVTHWPSKNAQPGAHTALPCRPGYPITAREHNGTQQRRGLVSPLRPYPRNGLEASSSGDLDPASDPDAVADPEPGPYQALNLVPDPDPVQHTLAL